MFRHSSKKKTSTIHRDWKHLSAFTNQINYAKDESFFSFPLLATHPREKIVQDDAKKRRYVLFKYSEV